METERESVFGQKHPERSVKTCREPGLYWPCWVPEIAIPPDVLLREMMKMINVLRA